ncbi:MAG: hypothetical protein MOGMAGMI_01448 [Candidatus Omnitrophica bacterium]|nr:hypothetical protein [Candidatus Omnitrophota bacterium]
MPAKTRSKSSSARLPKVDPYLEGLMAKLLDRLATLERKLDTLVGQQAHKAPSPAAPAPKPAEPPRRERTLYEAICAQCSKVCEVPFKPAEGRAVYCKTCFAARKSGGDRHGMPILTPVALPPKPVSRLGTPTAPAAPAAPAPKSRSSSKRTAPSKSRPKTKTKKR